VRESCIRHCYGIVLVFTLLITGLAIDVWLLTIVHRQHVRRHLPWFVLYIAWQVLLVLIQLTTWLINPRSYVTIYWWTEAIGVVVIVGAVRESFLRIFRGFTGMQWFRWTVSGVIAAVVAYSAWKAVYAPPVQGNRLTALVIGSEFLFRWGIAIIALLTTILSYLLNEPMDTWEDAVITGFGLASAAFVISVILVSFFGMRYLFLSKYIPSVGYFVAVFMWIRVFSRPVQGFGFKELGIGPEEMLRIMRDYREAVKAIRGK
jgi:hypothetical protein